MIVHNPKNPLFPSEYVAQMSALLNLRLTPNERAAYVTAVDFVLQQPAKPIAICDLHRIMMGGTNASKYRQAVVLNSSGEVKCFPRYTAIGQLMYSFRDAYSKALKPDGWLNREQLEVVAWAVAANGRCLHPFVCGNTRLFCLIENHIRQVHGLGWVVGLRNKGQFLAFKKMYQQRHAEFYSS